ASFQKELGALSYKFQFVTLSAFHALNHSMFELARAYRDKGMAAYSELQNREFASEKDGYAAVRHQEFVGVGYFDEITQIATGGQSSVTAMQGSTEQQQFHASSPGRQKEPARTAGAPDRTRARAPPRPGGRRARGRKAPPAGRSRAGWTSRSVVRAPHRRQSSANPGENTWRRTVARKTWRDGVNVSLSRFRSTPFLYVPPPRL